MGTQRVPLLASAVLGHDVVGPQPAAPGAGESMTTLRHRIGFVSTRLAGTDGVSLEAARWARILSALGHECFCLAGESDWPAGRSCIVPEAHFEHPANRALQADLFGDYVRSEATSQVVQTLKETLKKRLRRFVADFGLELLIIENALSLPMHVPLGLALAELIAETSLPVIAHHHDFAWERERFALNAAEDYLQAAFPPILPSIRHVVINSFAARQLALRTGSSSTLIPNVLDFDSPPAEPDVYAAGFHAVVGVRPGERLLLQPTRVVPRKRIELAIELARRLDLSCALVVTHQSGDEGGAYLAYLRGYADMLGVRLLLAHDHVAYHRGLAPGGRPIFALADAYQQCDLVTYPSRVEGFGNAFLEAVYYRRPIVMSTYDIFRTDIQPKGFEIVGFEDFITAECVAGARALLEGGGRVAAMTQHNYDLGRRYYSLPTLERRLAALLTDCLGTD